MMALRLSKHVAECIIVLYGCVLMVYLLICCLHSNTMECKGSKLNLCIWITEYFHFPLSVFCLQCFTLIFILILFLSEGQAGEACKVSNKSDAVSDMGKQW